MIHDGMPATDGGDTVVAIGSPYGVRLAVRAIGGPEKVHAGFIRGSVGGDLDAGTGRARTDRALRFCP